MGIEYRAITEGEVPEAVQLYAETGRDLFKRNGLDASGLQGSNEERLEEYHHIYKTGIFHVATSDGKIVAVANGIVREEQWYLSGYWTRPDFQKQGVGHPLLRQVWAEAMSISPRTAIVWASMDCTAIATYLKHGLMPYTALLRFGGKAIKKEAIPLVPGYTIKPLQVDAIGRLELEVRGTRREVDHRFFVSHLNAAFQVMKDKQCVGYFYCDDGTIGPAAWSHDDHAEGVLGLAVKTAQQQNEKIELVALGNNHRVVKTAMQLGLFLMRTVNLMVSGPVGELSRYLPSGPTLF